MQQQSEYQTIEVRLSPDGSLTYLGVVNEEVISELAHRAERQAIAHRRNQYRQDPLALGILLTMTGLLMAIFLQLVARPAPSPNIYYQQSQGEIRQ